jgi:hypothetical protein
MQMSGSAPKKSKSELYNAFWAAQDDALVERQTMAAGLCMSVAWANVIAVKGGGPAFIKFGRKSFYRKLDVVDWINKTGRKARSTSELSLTSA